MSVVTSRTLNQVSNQAPPVEQPTVVQQVAEASPEHNYSMKSQEMVKKIVFYMAITSFFLMWAVFYIFFQALNPWIVQQGNNCYKDACEKKPVDNGKCLVAGLILAVVFFIILYLIFSAF